MVAFRIALWYTFVVRKNDSKDFIKCKHCFIIFVSALKNDMKNRSIIRRRSMKDAERLQCLSIDMFILRKT